METARAAGRTFVDAPVQTSDKDLRAGGAESWVGDARLFDHGDYCCTRARALKTMSSPVVEAAAYRRAQEFELERGFQSRRKVKRSVSTKCTYDDI